MSDMIFNIKQTDFEPGSNIYFYSCRFKSLVAMAAYYAQLCGCKNTLSKDDVLDIAKEATALKLINSNFLVDAKGDSGIPNLVFKKLCFTDCRIIQIGGISSKKTLLPIPSDRDFSDFKNKSKKEYWSPVYTDKENFTIIEYFTDPNNKNSKHFTLGDINGKEIYNPWDSKKAGVLEKGFDRLLFYQAYRIKK